MIVRVKGGAGGVGEYLEKGRKAGRDYDREELDQRVVLTGSVTQLEAVINSFDRQQEHQKYLHITLSFKEKHISKETLEEINDKFRKFILTACDDDEFYYYSEAHLPKLQNLPAKDGNNYERFPHLHIVIPEYNLLINKREEPLFRVKDIEKYIDAFQEKINSDYSLSSPKDNHRVINSGREESLARYQFTPDMPVKDIKDNLYKFITEHPDITNVDELAASIKPFGKVRVRESKAFGGKYINFDFDKTGKRKAINLKDPIFLDAYLASRDIATSRAFLRGTRDDEKTLAEWSQSAAFEARFICPAAAAQREKYYAGSPKEKDAILQQKRSAHQQVLAALRKAEGKAQEYDYYYDINDQAIRHFEDIQHIEDMPNIEEMTALEDFPHIEDIENIEVSDERRNERNRKPNTKRGRRRTAETTQGTSRHIVHDMPSGNDYGSAGQRGFLSDQDILQSQPSDGLEREQEVTYSDVYLVRQAGEIGGITRILEDMQQRREHGAWTDKINHINMRVLLDYASHYYLLDTSKYQIERNKQGYERVVIDNRHLSASDFLTKRLNVPWPEAKQILNKVLVQQERGGYRKDSITSLVMWRRFQKYEAELPGLGRLGAEYRKKQQAIRQRYKWEYDHSYSSAQNVVKRRLLGQKKREKLAAAATEYQQARRYYVKRPNDRYLDFLHTEALDDNQAALGELQRIYPTFENSRDNSLLIAFRDDNRAIPAFSKVDMGYRVSIRKNGTVDYKDENDNTVISDSYKAIRVYQRDVETITKALMIAKARFGVNGFEIQNSKQEDLKAIQEAVSRTQTDVSLVPQTKVTVEQNRK